MYLVTSRDGVHVDDGWIYAHRPLLNKGKRQRDWDSGMLLPAPQIMTDNHSHRVYFEARRTNHERRFQKPAKIGVATWARDRLVGLRQAQRSPARGGGEVRGVVETKPLMLATGVTALVLDVEHYEGLSVEVIDDAGKTLDGFSADTCRPVHLVHGQVEVHWSGKFSIADVAARATPVRLRFLLSGGRVKLYSFALR